MFFRPLISPFGEGTNRGRRGVKNADLVTIDDAPESIGLGRVGRAFIHHAGGAVLQRSIDDVAVAGDPSDVGGAPVGVVFFEVEDPLRGDVGADRVSAGGVNDALRLAGGSGGVEDVERVLGIKRLGGTL